MHMTKAKKLKKIIRERATKTGERYTAARRQVLLAREKKATAPKAAVAPVGRSAPRGGISDAAVAKKTGHGFDHWFAVLDAFDVATKGHTAGAGHLHSTHGVPGWHAQMITVAYERTRGLRVANQGSTGGFQVSVSKTVGASVAAVAAVFNDARRREQWLKTADAELRRGLNAALGGAKAKQVVLKSADYGRLRYAWDGAVEIRITGKPKGSGCTVVADNMDLKDAGEVERRRAAWRAALEALKEHQGR
jgi:hypothetical protein